MRFLSCLLIALTLSIAAFAKCASNGLTVFPSTSTIAPQGIIMIEGYALSQDIIKGLGGKHAVYLKSKSHRVQLKVIEVLTGDMQLTQAILKPATPLRKGQTYTLHIGNLPPNERLLLYDENGNASVVAWKVADAPAKPLLNGAPKYIDQSYVEYGCGPAVYMNFMVPVHDATPYLVKAIVNADNGTTHSYYIVPEADGKVRLGNGMCSGAFLFAYGTKYTASFALLSATGQLSGATAPISFERTSTMPDNTKLEWTY